MREIEYNKNKGKEYKLACVKCDGKTCHEVLMSVHVHESEDEVDVWRDYEIICCQGCKEVSFRRCSMCSEDVFMNPNTGEPELEQDVKLYPSRIAGRKQIKDMYLMPNEVLQIYKETHGALCGRFSILAGIGIRTLVESVCREKNTQGSNLKHKINDLVVKGFLTQNGADILHGTRLMGNKSVHEITAASEEELDIAMDIVENLVKNVYIIPQKSKKLNSKE